MPTIRAAEVALLYFLWKTLMSRLERCGYL
jgi:hypothetical protein